jgi:hypothetical protein
VNIHPSLDTSTLAGFSSRKAFKHPAPPLAQHPMLQLALDQCPARLLYLFEFSSLG